MTASSRLVLVVAAALIDDAGRVLLAQRPAGKSLAGLWEFPGGKVEPGETPEQALSRELSEELGVQTKVADFVPLTFASHSYEAFHLLMPLYLCRAWHGAPDSREGQKLSWATANELENYPMPPADLPLIPAIQAALMAPNSSGAQI